MRSLLVLLLVLAAAGAFYFATQSSDEGPATPASLTTEQGPVLPDAGDDSPAEAELVSGAGNGGTRTGAPRTLANPAGDDVELPVAKGTGVGGRIETTEGAPIADAEIVLTKHGMSTIFFADPASMDRSGDMRTTSDVDGTFLFENVQQGSGWAIIANHADYARHEEGPYQVVDGETVEVIVRLKPGVALTGMVTDTSGGPVPDAQLTLALSALGMMGGESEGGANDPNVIRTTTDAGGRYEMANLATGSYVLTASADGFGKVMIQSISVSGDQPIEQDVQLQVASALGGRVTSAGDGSPIDGARVDVYSIATVNSRTQTSAHTTESGEFLVQDIPDGEYTLRFSAEGFEALPVMRVSSGDMSMQVQLKPLPTVSGRIVDAETGKPLTTFTVALRQGVEQSEMSMRVAKSSRQITDEDGRYELRVPARGKYSVEAFTKGYAPSFSEVFELSDGMPRQGIDVRVNKGGRISGRVTDTSGNPIVGALVETQDNHWTGSEFDLSLGAMFPGKATKKKRRTDAQGRFVFQGLTPASYQVHITHKDYTKTVMKNVAVAVGQQTDAGDFVVTAGASVSGIVRGPNGKPLMGATITLSLEPGPNAFPISHSAKTNREGKYTIDHVRSGTYWVHAVRPTQGADNPFTGAMDVKNTRRQLPVNEGGEYAHIDFDLTN